jgi:hypothetical protein
VIIGRQSLAGLPKRIFLSPRGKPEGEWTFALPFLLEGPVPPLPGLYLAAIGDNWDIYLNGTLVRREMHLKGGKIREHHSQRDVFFPIDRSLLLAGENLLVFHIVGDPTDATVGFQYSAPFYLADYGYIERRNSEIMVMFLVGVFILVGIYHLLIFLIHRVEYYNGYCGIFSLLMGLYFFFPHPWHLQPYPQHPCSGKAGILCYLSGNSSAGDFYGTALCWAYPAHYQVLYAFFQFSGPVPACFSPPLRQRCAGSMADNGNCGAAVDFGPKYSCAFCS